MNSFYEWLYDHYAAPKICDAAFPLAYQDQKRQWLELTHRLTPQERLLTQDFINTLRACWGAEAFTQGVMAGIQMCWTPPGPED